MPAAAPRSSCGSPAAQGPGSLRFRWRTRPQRRRWTRCCLRSRPWRRWPPSTRWWPASCPNPLRTPPPRACTCTSACGRGRPTCWHTTRPGQRQAQRAARLFPARHLPKRLPCQDPAIWKPGTMRARLPAHLPAFPGCRRACSARPCCRFIRLALSQHTGRLLLPLLRCAGLCICGDGGARRAWTVAHGCAAALCPAGRGRLHAVLAPSA